MIEDEETSISIDIIDYNMPLNLCLQHRIIGIIIIVYGICMAHLKDHTHTMRFSSVYRKC